MPGSDDAIPGGGYSLCDGWYICAAVLTPFFHFGRIEHDLFGVFFSSTNSKAIFWGTKTTNFYKNRSFWPQIQFFPRSFWVQFSAASGTPPSVFRPSTPPGDAIKCGFVSDKWQELHKWLVHQITRPSIVRYLLKAVPNTLVSGEIMDIFCNYHISK